MLSISMCSVIQCSVFKSPVYRGIQILDVSGIRMVESRTEAKQSGIQMGSEYHTKKVWFWNGKTR